MVALRVMGRLVLWLSVVLGASVAFAWSWDHAEQAEPSATTPAALQGR